MRMHLFFSAQVYGNNYTHSITQHSSQRNQAQRLCFKRMSNTATIRSIGEGTTYNVPVLVGAAEHLVTLREKLNAYNTNPQLKYWASWFLLKSISTSSKIDNWVAQRDFLKQYLRLSDGTLRKQIGELARMGVITKEADGALTLASYKQAAQVMDIPYRGTTIIQYKPHTYGNETQVFRYFLVALEVKSNQLRQLEELNRKFQKNLSGNTTDLLLALNDIGADIKQVYRDPQYLQQQLLKLQKRVFRDKSGLANVAFSLRADLNRSCSTLADAHGYAHGQSASFIKKKLQILGAAKVTKCMVHSKERTRLYIPLGDGQRKDGYKWVKGRKNTAWVLCDQVDVLLHNGSATQPDNLKKAA